MGPKLAPQAADSLPSCYNNEYTAAIVQWQNAALWLRMSWVRTPLAAPDFPKYLHRIGPLVDKIAVIRLAGLWRNQSPANIL